MVTISSIRKYDNIPNIWGMFEFEYTIEDEELLWVHNSAVFAKNEDEAKAKIYLHYYAFNFEIRIDPRVKTTIERLKHKQLDLI